MSRERGKHRAPNHNGYNPEKNKARYFDNIREIISAAGGEGLFESIPRKGLRLLYWLRFLPINIVAAPGENIPDDVLRDMRRELPDAMDWIKVSVLKDGTEIPLRIFQPAGLPFLYYLRELEGNGYRGAHELEGLLDRFLPMKEALEQVNLRLAAVMIFLGLIASDLGSRIYWLEFRVLSNGKNVGKGTGSIMRIHVSQPNRIRMMLGGGGVRNVIRLIMPLPYGIGLKGHTVEAKRIGLEGTQLETYIEEHALRRLAERLDCIDRWRSYLHLFEALSNPRALASDGGTIMLEYRCMGLKVGYLVGEVHSHKLVIRTFLFVTNDGTPEGKQLEKMWGLARLDKKTLAIDKLSTFVSLDIGSDARLASIFSEAGCGDLMKVRDELGKDGDEGSASRSMEFMVKYLSGTGFFEAEEVEGFES